MAYSTSNTATTAARYRGSDGPKTRVSEKRTAGMSTFAIAATHTMVQRKCRRGRGVAASSPELVEMSADTKVIAQIIQQREHENTYIGDVRLEAVIAGRPNGRAAPRLTYMQSV